MKFPSLFSAAIASLVIGAYAMPAYAAKPPTAATVLCSDSTATTGNSGYLACQGPIDGNLAPGQVDTATFAGYGTFTFVGKSDDPLAGPFSLNQSGATSGTLSFDTAQKGWFVLGIKGGPDYSLYLFDGGTTGISSLAFDTLGIVTGAGAAGPGLSHFALFRGASVPPTSVVPEPDAYALMLAGLGVVGFVAKRRATKG